MNILIVGCKRVGSVLAYHLQNMGHEISVIAENESDLNDLSADFEGFTTYGTVIDLEVLKRAGIESCDAVCAMSEDDNVNLMVSQVAKEVFKVPVVVGRIYDARREDVFSHFGLTTVCPTNLTVSAVESIISGHKENKNLTVGAGTFSFRSLPVTKELSGIRVSRAESILGEVPFAVIHKDNRKTMCAKEDVKLEIGDTLILAKEID